MASMSTIALAKAALFELLSHVDWPTPMPVDEAPTVSYGWPYALDREAIILGDVESSDQDWFTFGQRTRSESYALAMTFVVTRPGDDQREATERAFALLSAAEDAIRDSVSTLLAGLPHVVRISGPDLVELSGDEGRRAIVDVNLLVEGNI